MIIHSALLLLVSSQIDLERELVSQVTKSACTDAHGRKIATTTWNSMKMTSEKWSTNLAPAKVVLNLNQDATTWASAQTEMKPKTGNSICGHMMRLMKKRPNGCPKSTIGFQLFTPTHQAANLSTDSEKRRTLTGNGIQTCAMI